MVGGHDHEGDPLLQYVERFATVLVAAGFPAMPARVFVAFLISESDRLTAADLATMLQISPAAVSGGVRYLTGVGLVHKERVPGSRRDHYRIPADVWSEVMRLQSQVLVRWGSLLREGVDLVGSGTRAGGRLTAHTEFFDFLSTEIPGMLDRWDEISQRQLRSPTTAPEAAAPFESLWSQNSNPAPGSAS
jgi:predicted transcriptional regulator